ncbi:MAG: thiamine ABC transporter substrate-binding protein, partial [archaeon]
PELSKKIVIENPNTSSPGMALLLWSVKLFGDPGYKEFWKKLKPNILTVTEGWSQAAGMFEAGEAPIYLSYATSPAYYAGEENKQNFVGAKFREGHYIQIEGMGIVSGTKNRALAEQFIEFSLEPQFQQEIPLTQYMFPVNANVKLPESFGFAVKPDKSLELDRKFVEKKQEEWVREWEKIMSTGP